MNAIRITVQGRVQGVWFRDSTRKKAVELGLSGWVRNTLSGDVEIHAQGSGEKLELFTNWCHEGPVLAHVTTVSVDTAGVDESLSDFSVLY